MEYCFSIGFYTHADRKNCIHTFHTHAFSITRTCDGANLSKYCDSKKEEKLYQILYKLALQNKFKKVYETKITKYSYEECKHYGGFVKTDIDLINFLND